MLILNIIALAIGISKHVVQEHVTHFYLIIKRITIISWTTPQRNTLHCLKSLSKFEYLLWTVSPVCFLHIKLRAIFYLMHCSGTKNIKSVKADVESHSQKQLGGTTQELLLRYPCTCSLKSTHFAIFLKRTATNTSLWSVLSHKMFLTWIWRKKWMKILISSWTYLRTTESQPAAY